jgi:uncharacterized protein with HEPN domain
MQKDEAYLQDILEAAKAIVRFTSGVSREDFKANEEKYEAVNRKFEIIGEAARHLSPSMRAKLPQVPWKLLTAMRNILIHDYDDVDLDVVWDTIQRDLSPLIAQIQSYCGDRD